MEDVLKFNLNGKVFTLNEADGRYYSEDGNWANYVSMLNDEVIKFRGKRIKKQKIK